MSFLAPLVPPHQQNAQSRRAPLPPLPATASYPSYNYELVGTEYVRRRPYTASSGRITVPPSLSSSSSVPDLKAFALASGPNPSSSLCTSAGPSQASFERPHTATGSTSRTSRPLPKVPHRPSTSVSSTPPPHTGSTYSFRRPLPTPPSASPQQSAFVPAAALSPPPTRESTPVPPPPPTPTSAAMCSTSSQNTRPLPKPVLRLLPEKALPPPPIVLPLGASAKAEGMAPVSYLRVNIPGSSLGVAEFVLESPMCPPSPILFKAISPGSALSPIRDDAVARRLSTMGFVEVGVAQPSSSSTEKRRGAVRRGASPEQVPVLALPDDGASDETDSSSACEEDEEEDEAQPALKQPRHDIEITVEYIPPSTNTTSTSVAGTNAKRISRRWIREKRGKRWVEDDYSQILEALRRL